MNVARARPFLLLLLAVAGLQAAPAVQAQQRVECHSPKYGYRECAAPWPRVELIQRISESECIEGRTWGQRGDRIWVDRGCAAAFGPARGPGWDPGRPGAAGREIECRSERFGYAECAVGWRSARLVRQTSKTECIENRNWGVRRGTIWVDKGCTAIFAEEGRGGGWGGGERIECNSERNRYKACPVGNWRGARLVRQTSNAACIEGRTWGLQNGTLWVDKGCAGEFEASRRGGATGAGPGVATVTCNSPKNGYRACAAPGWRGARLLRQTSNAACIQGRSWGLSRDTLWVDEGCAGEFGKTH
jgi:hypothetical protein